jgi:large subunit ribosomal protein L9
MSKKQEVLLVQDVLKLGNMGDLVKVAPGFARNYLYPYQMAVPASQAHKRQVAVLREKAAKNEAEREGKAKSLQKTLVGLTVQVGAKVAHDDELFGSVGAKEIVAAIAAKAKVQLDLRQVHLTDRLRRLGRFDVEVSLHKNVPLTVKVEVVNSDPNAPSLDETLKALAASRAEREAAIKAAKEAAKAAKAEEGGAEAPAADAAPAKAEKADKPAKGGKADKAEKTEKAGKAGKKG